MSDLDQAREEFERRYQEWCAERFDAEVERLIRESRRGYQFTYSATHSEQEIDLREGGQREKEHKP